MTLTPTCPMDRPHVFPSPGWAEHVKLPAGLHTAIARHAAPTILGHKAGSLFLWKGDAGDMHRAIYEADQRLAPAGVRVVHMGRCLNGTRVYVYRPALLLPILQEAEVAALLRDAGYDDLDHRAVNTLRQRMVTGNGFPHEIGLFLGYPLADVKGFIQHGGANCLLSGCWKVYDDPEAAAHAFALYKRCRHTCIALLNRGVPLCRLACRHPKVKSRPALCNAASHTQKHH